MARLVNPGTGELADRYGILTLKILHAPEGANVDHFRREKSVLETQLRNRSGWWALGQELAVVNAMLWYAEDELREYRKQDLVTPGDLPLSAVVRCAFRIQSLNDQRAVLIGQINAQCGEDYGPEKLRTGESA